MSKLDYSQEVSPRSRAWCADCTFKAWGTHAHQKAKAHFAAEPGHLIHVVTPEKIPYADET
jgi:hypothetical protein